MTGFSPGDARQLELVGFASGRRELAEREAELRACEGEVLRSQQSLRLWERKAGQAAEQLEDLDRSGLFAHLGKWVAGRLAGGKHVGERAGRQQLEAELKTARSSHAEIESVHSEWLAKHDALAAEVARLRAESAPYEQLLADKEEWLREKRAELRQPLDESARCIGDAYELRDALRAVRDFGRAAENELVEAKLALRINRMPKPHGLYLGRAVQHLNMFEEGLATQRAVVEQLGVSADLLPDPGPLIDEVLQAGMRETRGRHSSYLDQQAHVVELLEALRSRIWLVEKQHEAVVAKVSELVAVRRRWIEEL
ncbi:MAG: hypothetical protein AB8H80_05590 [Planctomycetota bacterium]